MTNSLPAAVQGLLESNAAWADRTVENDPSYFERLSNQQKPKFLWIGCADSRVPATQVVDVNPGEIFVHRNVANLVLHSDMNCLSSIQFAVDVLKVEHILVCGHYGCGGVGAVVDDASYGLVDNWVNNIQATKHLHQSLLSACQTHTEKHDLLCELNVIEQVTNVCETSIVRAAWDRGQALSVSGIIYGLHDGKLKDLQATVSQWSELNAVYQTAIAALSSR